MGNEPASWDAMIGPAIHQGEGPGEGIQALGYSLGEDAGVNLLDSGPGCATRLKRAQIEGDIMGFMFLGEKKHCPQCGSRSVHRSRRRGAVERMVCALLGISPLRCD